MQAVDVLKEKAIKEYNKILKQLQNGYTPNLNILMDLISFINLPQNSLDNQDFVAEYLLNRNDTIYLHFNNQC